MGVLVKGGVKVLNGQQRLETRCRQCFFGGGVAAVVGGAAVGAGPGDAGTVAAGAVVAGALRLTEGRGVGMGERPGEPDVGHWNCPDGPVG